MNHNELGDGAAVALARVLGDGAAPNLEHLWLGGNFIGDAGAAALARALHPGSRCESSLTLVALYSNEIGDAGAEALARALEDRAATAEGRGHDGYGPLPPVSLMLFGHRIERADLLERLRRLPGVRLHESGSAHGSPTYRRI